MNNSLEDRLDKVFTTTLGLAKVGKNLSQKNCASWDSVNHLSLILALESEFGIQFEPEEIATMLTRADVLSVIEKKISL